MKRYLWKTRYFLIFFVLAILVGFFLWPSKEERLAGHHEKASAYLEKNELDHAVLELENIVQLDPENADAYFQLGEAYMQLDQSVRAVQSFIKCLSISPGNQKAQLRMGQIFLLVKRLKDARTTAKIILKKSPDNIEAMELLAGVQIQETDLKSAIKSLEKAASIDPKRFKTHIFLAHLYLLESDIDNAEKAYLNAISTGISSRDTYLELTHLYSSRGQWEKAEAILKKMVQTPGKKVRKLLDLAIFYESLKKWDQAEKTYLKAVNSDSNESDSNEEVDPLMRLGSFYGRRGLFDQALDAMTKAATAKNDDPSIITRIAQLYLNFNKIDEAEAMVDKVLGEYKDHREANYTKGRIYFARKDYANAYRRFDLVIQQDPNNAMAYYLKAVCVLEKGTRNQHDLDVLKAAAGFSKDTGSWERKLAKENLLKAVELNPRMPDARLSLAEIYMHERKPQQALEQLGIVLKSDPLNLKALTLKGSLKIMERDLKGAEAVCKKVLTLNPNLSEWHVRLGIVFSLMKRNDDALESFKKALELNPLQVDALQLIINKYLRQKNYKKAIEICEQQKKRISKDRSGMAFIENLQGKILLAKRDLKGARHHFEKAVDYNPDILSPHVALAKIYTREKKRSKAILEYETILEMNPEYLPASMALGVIHDRMGEKDKAEEYYRKVLRIKSGHALAANNLAFILAQDDTRIGEAFDLALLAKEKMPNNENVMDTLGWIYYLKGSYGHATSELQKSLALNPDNALANYHLGLVYYEKKEFKKAKKLVKKALTLDQDFVGADDARNMLD